MHGNFERVILKDIANEKNRVFLDNNEEPILFDENSKRDLHTAIKEYWKDKLK